MHACERCYSRKTKCDRRLPQCSSCTKSHSICQYPNKRRDRQLQQEYLKSVELRLQELQHENERLKGEVQSQNQEQPQNSVHTVPAIPDHGAPPTAPSSHTHHRPSISQHPFSEPNPADAQQSPAQSVGSLQRTPSEATRYLGSSNGVEFVDVVERVVDSSHTGGLFSRVTDSQRISDRVALPSIPQVPMLVEQTVAMPLIKSYFDHWHLIFPLLYRPSFMHMVEQMYADPQFYRQNAACAFVFDMVLALGSVPAKRVEWGFGDAESHFVRALTRLDEVSGFRDIRSLQALLLYCRYGIHASLRDTSSEMWDVLGKATRKCVELGLHYNRSTILPGCETHITGPVPVVVQVEMQRRCFWCYYNLERIVNISLGRPLALHDDDIHVPLPSTQDDDALDQPADANSPSHKTSPFLQHIRLRRIQAKIHRCMYTSRSIQTLPLRERQTVRREIFNDLQTWLKDVSLLDLPSPEQAATSSSSYLNPGWYMALYHSGCLLLFRPSATFPAMEGLEDDEDIDDVLQMIWDSSRHVLSNYFKLLRARHLNYSWVCLYTIFMAGLANVYAIGCCAQRRKRGKMAFLPSFWDVISTVRDCSDILTAICERWHDARGSCDIFNRLSMSALKELAAVSFQPKVDGVESGKADGQITVQTAPMNGHDRDLAGAHPTILTPEPCPSSAEQLSDTVMALDQYPEGPFDFDPSVDFQQLFEEMQNSIHARDHAQTDEVMLGFSQEWFER